MQPRALTDHDCRDAGGRATQEQLPRDGNQGEKVRLRSSREAGLGHGGKLVASKGSRRPTKRRVGSLEDVELPRTATALTAGILLGPMDPTPAAQAGMTPRSDRRLG